MREPEYGGFIYKAMQMRPHPCFIIDEGKVEIIGNIFDNPELLEGEE